MKKLSLSLLVYIIILSATLSANTNVSLQLAWKHQFQFAGYYIAKEKGFYDAAGLNVTIKEYDDGVDITNDVVSTKEDFGVGRSSLIYDKYNNKPVVMLGAIFQHSPVILLSKKRDDIVNIEDLKNKKIMLTSDQVAMASINAMLQANQITPQMYTTQKHSFNVQDLIDGKTDVMLSYISNEPYALQQQNIPYTIFAPKDYNFDFYSDILFTSEALLKKSPDLVKDFREASLKGWEYALNHKEETIAVILKKYNSQQKTKGALLYEAEAIAKLVAKNEIELGNIDSKRIEYITQIYSLMGLIKEKKTIDGLIYKVEKSNTKNSLNLTQEEKKWIETHSVKVGVEQWTPVVFSNDGKDIDGIAGDFTKKIINRTGLKVQIINDNWDKLLKDFKDKKVDLLPATYHTDKRAKFGLYSDGYFKMKDAFYLKSSNIEVESLKDLEGKTLAIPKGYGTIDKLQKEFPKINLVFTKDLDDSINRVLNGRVTAFYEGQIAAKTKIKSELIEGLKSISVTEFEAPFLHFFSTIDEPLLQSIIQKSLTSLKYQEKQSIVNKWASENNKLRLTNKEQEWLNKKEVIRYVYDPDRAPFEWTNELGQHTGIISDILKLISATTGIKLKAIHTQKRTDSVKKMEEKNADMYSAVVENKKRATYAKFTSKNIYKSPAVIVTRTNDATVYLDIKSALESKMVGLVKGYVISDYVEQTYPNLKFKSLNSIQEGFEKLQDEEIDTFMLNASTAQYYIKQKGFEDIRIASKIDFDFVLKIAVQKDLPAEVLSILDKAIDSISEKELSDIYHKWIQVSVKTKTNWLLIGEVGSVLLLILLFILWNNYKLKSTVKKKTAELRSLLDAFDANVIASSADLKGVITYVSDAFCEITGYAREELLGKPHNLIRHPDMPKEVFKDLWTTIQSGKVWKGEIKNRTKGGGFYWVDAVITPQYNSKHEMTGYSAIRHEITAKKEVEELSASLEQKVNERTKALNKQLRVVRIGERKQTELIQRIDEQKHEVEAIHKHTRESIEYASLIQGAVVSDENEMKPFFKDHFVHWIPKDTVGGDIWLFNALRDKDECLVMFIDCTGHGVPGAFVTMIVKAVEREIIANLKKNPDFDISPAKIMSHFNSTMKLLLKQETKDSISNAGWDGGIIYYNKKTQILKFAGAETPLFYLDSNGKFNTIKGNRYSVGYKKCSMNYEYKETILEVEEGMKFYCTTDGYIDQNGGEKDFPFGKKRFGKIIQEHHNKSMDEQKNIFIQQMTEYESMIENNDRNDDITVIAFEIGGK